MKGVKNILETLVISENLQTTKSNQLRCDNKKNHVKL